MMNHLWQSTLFAIAAGLLTLALRRNRAAVRYGVWLAASAKFLVPFSLLMLLGNAFERTPVAQKAVAQVPVAVSSTMLQWSEPFSGTAVLQEDSRNWAAIAIIGVWACGFLAIAAMRLQGWLRIRAALRASAPLQIDLPVEVRATPGLLEPGVVGFWRSVLLLPAGIVDRLTPKQLQAVLTHELCHIRRRDNLTSAVHMLVEAVFWFHPLVWWIGARLVEERERACDEEVLRITGDSNAYAEGILNICKLYTESPLACVSGVTGSDIKRRIEAIMANRMLFQLNLTKKVALAAAAVFAVALPVFVGLVNTPFVLLRASAQTPTAPSFEVASIRPHAVASAQPVNGKMIAEGMQMTFAGPTARVTGATLSSLIAFVYDLKPYETGEGNWPAWKSDRFDILAKAEGDGALTRDQFRPLFQALLTERFKLKFHRETKQMSGYMLTLAKNGPKLNPSDPDAKGFMSMTGTNYAAMTVVGWTMDQLARYFSTTLREPVLDGTGLAGSYDFKLAWSDTNGAYATFFTALQEQLGLKLERHREPVQVFVVDSAMQPSLD